MTISEPAGVGTAMGRRSNWLPIDTAPRDGRAIRIRGFRFMRRTRYTAEAVWATRKCPAVVTDWFPATDEHDGQGPFGDVTDWQPLPVVLRAMPA